MGLRNISASFKNYGGNMSEIRILAIGDVVGESGTSKIRSSLWDIRKELRADAVIVNGENSGAKGGIDKASAEMLFAGGADVITTGNHVWQIRQFADYLENSVSVLRPANYPSQCPGRGYGTFDVCGYKMLVISLQGTVFMDSLDSPFLKAEAILEREKGDYDFVVVDFHAEATSEKIAFGLAFDGRVSVVFGTHTHIQTNDARIFDGGTGYVTDIGMTGVYNSVLGVDPQLMIKKFYTKMPQYHNTAVGEVTISGAVFTIDTDSFKCKNVELINIK